MALPTLTPEQRAAALAKAAEVRKARSELLASLKSGEKTIQQVLANAKTDVLVGKTKVVQLLKALPGYGPAKVTALMEETGVDANRRAAGLGDKQRAALLDKLA
ncbi:integration host factor [Solihabitans fulvus]|uniref:Integration host factor n=1 Tax=Solihabitans fulvus TaxID=1892852 RepID=A0A5B2XU47_9PSEU|nr:integration host factor, actinobacterial type [Solihabitans fulvus]KAA2267026.1 integration host factor [Solihabitans fulvus]